MGPAPVSQQEADEPTEATTPDESPLAQQELTEQHLDAGEHTEHTEPIDELTAEPVDEHLGDLAEEQTAEAPVEATAVLSPEQETTQDDTDSESESTDSEVGSPEQPNPSEDDSPATHQQPTGTVPVDSGQPDPIQLPASTDVADAIPPQAENLDLDPEASPPGTTTSQDVATDSHTSDEAPQETDVARPAMPETSAPAPQITEPRRSSRVRRKPNWMTSGNWQMVQQVNTAHRKLLNRVDEFIRKYDESRK